MYCSFWTEAYNCTRWRAEQF